MTDDRFDVCVIGIGRDSRVGQDVPGVEDVQSLVFHGAHVEVADGDDHEAVEIEFQTETGFVPPYAVFERFHRVGGLVQVVFLDPDLQQDIAAVGQFECFFPADQIARHQGKEVGWFSERIVPYGVVAVVGQVSCFDQIAVGEQNRVFFLVGTDRDGIGRHHIGAVWIPGDFPESFGFALGEKVAVGKIKSHQGGVLVRMDERVDDERDIIGGIGDTEFAVVCRIV